MPPVDAATSVTDKVDKATASPPPGGTNAVADDTADDGDEGTDAAETSTTNGKAAPSGDRDTLLADGDDDDDRAPAPASWPDDWRVKFAAGDEKLLKRLQRFASPDSVAKSWRAAEQKISSGEYIRKLPKDATPEQKAAWRKEQGLPETPGAYVPPTVDGHQWTEADKPVLEEFFTRAHETGMPQEHVDAALAFYADQTRMAAESRAQADREFKQSSEDALRSEYGNDYRAHINLYKRVLEDKEIFPGDSAAILSQARASDGSRLINHPDVARALINLGLQNYGEGGLKTGEEAQRMSSREDEIKKILATDADRYFRENLGDELLQITRAKEGGGRRRK